MRFSTVEVPLALFVDCSKRWSRANRNSAVNRGRDGADSVLSLSWLRHTSVSIVYRSLPSLLNVCILQHNSYDILESQLGHCSLGALDAGLRCVCFGAFGSAIVGRERRVL